jgi:hypothetical protein
LEAVEYKRSAGVLEFGFVIIFPPDYLVFVVEIFPHFLYKFNHHYFVPQSAASAQDLYNAAFAL